MGSGDTVRDGGPSPLVQAVTVQALRRIEQAGALDDAVELRRALQQGHSRARQIALRCRLLGERLGLPRELVHWRVLGMAMGVLFALAMALAGRAAARSVLAPDHSINAVAALFGLLALPTITLLLWLLGFAWGPGGRGPAVGKASFGRLALAALQRLPAGGSPYARPLLQAFAEVLQRARLWPWFTGVASHGVWLLALLITLAGLVFGFSFQTYRLSWETTILSPGFFERLVHVTGWLPAVIGFPVPDPAAVQQVGHAGAQAALDPAAQRDWAWWLIGCVVTYGVLPRPLLVLVSGWRWRAGVSRVQPVDLKDPYVQQLARRLDALAPSPGVLDPDAGRSPVGAGGQMRSPAAAGAPMVLAYELPPEAPWLPAGLDPAGMRAEWISGGADERAALLAMLADDPARALLVVLAARSTPDRGTGRFLREAAAGAARHAILLVDAGAAPVGDPPEAALTRWRDWLRGEGLEWFRVVQTAAEARRWLESGDA